ncbi:unnamed protein product [Durusdinium trenchii]|uniref:Uncharacterized protein n=1 Tax=Durusdinium trenchii TaxID=1381693 RepID=A0ABP0NDK3_9DINO
MADRSMGHENAEMAQAVAAALHAAGARRMKAKAASMAAQPPELLVQPKRKKEVIVKDANPTGEKVTPDPKLQKTETSETLSSSVSKSSDETLVQNLMDRLDAVAGEIVEVHDTQDALDPTLVLDSQPDPLDSFWNSTEAPESLSTLKSTESTLTLPYSPGTMDGIAASMMTTEAQKAVLASVLTEQALPASCLHRSVPLATPSEPLAQTAAKPTEGEVIPVATPTRAMIEYWARFRVEKKHVTPAAVLNTPSPGSQPHQHPTQVSQQGTSLQADPGLQTTPAPTPAPDALQETSVDPVRPPAADIAMESQPTLTPSPQPFDPIPASAADIAQPTGIPPPAPAADIAMEPHPTLPGTQGTSQPHDPTPAADIAQPTGIPTPVPAAEPQPTLAGQRRTSQPHDPTPAPTGIPAPAPAAEPQPTLAGQQGTSQPHEASAADIAHPTGIPAPVPGADIAMEIQPTLAGTQGSSQPDDTIPTSAADIAQPRGIPPPAPAADIAMEPQPTLAGTQGMSAANIAQPAADIAMEPQPTQQGTPSQPDDPVPAGDSTMKPVPAPAANIAPLQQQETAQTLQSATSASSPAQAPAPPDHSLQTPVQPAAAAPVTDLVNAALTTPAPAPKPAAAADDHVKQPATNQEEAVVDSKKAERYRKIRAAKAKFHRSVRCASCPEPVKAKLRAMAGSRDQLEWDKFYDEYVNCGGKWANSELVMNSYSTSSHERRGRWKTMSRTALLAKYQDEVIVDEIIARKTEQGLWIANADLPDNEALREYWCWDGLQETDRNTRANTVSTTSTGHLDGATAAMLQKQPLAANEVRGHLTTGGGACSCASCIPKAETKAKACPQRPQGPQGKDCYPAGKQGF